MYVLYNCKRHFLSFVYIMRLRIRHAEGMATLSDAKQEDTVAMLKDAIKNAISLSAAQDIQSKITWSIILNLFS